MLINDQLDPSVPEDENGDPIPPGPNPNGSDATVEVTVLGSRFSGNGNTEGVSVSDNDGLRVNEGGLGDLKLTVRLSVFEENGADGIEVDERGDGDARVDMLLYAAAREWPVRRKRSGRRVTPSDRCHGASEYWWGDDGKQRDGYRRSLRAYSRLN